MMMGGQENAVFPYLMYKDWQQRLRAIMEKAWRLGGANVEPQVA